VKTVWKKIGDSGSHHKSISHLTCTCGYRWIVTHHNVSKGAQDWIRVIDYGEPWRADLRRLWDDRSYSIRRIAARLHASHSTIRRQAQELGLVMPRNERQRKGLPASADFLARRRGQRTFLKEFLQRHPSAIRRDLIKEHQNLYVWFMRWDRSWFDHCLPPRQPFTSPEQPRRMLREILATTTTVNVVLGIDIQALSDAELAQLVRSTALRMVEEGSLLRICWPALRRQIPELSISQGQLHKLPLTHAALRDVTETGEEACVRRIFLLARQWIAQGQRIKKCRLLEHASAGFYYKMHKSPMIHRALQTVLGGNFE
jgi:AraC-like DNA-binding protein